MNEKLHTLIKRFIFLRDSIGQEYTNLTEREDNLLYDLYQRVIGEVREAAKPDPEITEFEAAVQNVLNSIRDLLVYKNKKYGNSALEPIRVFSKESALEQLNVRVDDKLSRIKNSGNNHSDEDTEFDLIGYLILKRIMLRKSGGEDATARKTNVSHNMDENPSV